MKYFLLVGSIIAVVSGQILLKYGVSKTPIQGNIQSIIKTLFSPFVLLGLCTYGAAVIVWLLALQKFPLSIAAPTMSLSYLIIFLYSYFVLREPISIANVAGLLLVIIGVVLINIK